MYHRRSENGPPWAGISFTELRSAQHDLHKWANTPQIAVSTSSQQPAPNKPPRIVHNHLEASERRAHTPNHQGSAFSSHNRGPSSATLHEPAAQQNGSRTVPVFSQCPRAFEVTHPAPTSAHTRKKNSRHACVAIPTSYLPHHTPCRSRRHTGHGAPPALPHLHNNNTNKPTARWR